MGFLNVLRVSCEWYEYRSTVSASAKLFITRPEPGHTRRAMPKKMLIIGGLPTPQYRRVVRCGFSAGLVCALSFRFLASSLSQSRGRIPVSVGVRLQSGSWCLSPVSLTMLHPFVGLSFPFQTTLDPSDSVKVFLDNFRSL